MFGLNQNGANIYAKISMETGVLAASPNKLVVMLYEGAISACYSAVGYMQNNDIPKKGGMLSKAIMIIESGLRASLDKKVGGELAANLDALYAYMSMRLMQANIRNQPELVNEVIVLLADLKDAWQTIEVNQILSQPMPKSAPRLESAQTAAVMNRNIASYAKV